ncbi:hypothetical protein Hdeb2414_s0019g00546761 [Helianthus debilis subsp. tardiflorus]
MYFMLECGNKILWCDIYTYAHVHKLTKYVTMRMHIICHTRLLRYLTYMHMFFLNGQQTQSRALSGHPLDKRSTPRVTRVHHQFRGKPGNPPDRRHDSEITGKTRLAQGSNPCLPGYPIIAHQCLTLHQVGVEPASLKRNASPPPLDLEITGYAHVHCRIAMERKLKKKMKKVILVLKSRDEGSSL